MKLDQRRQLALFEEIILSLSHCSCDLSIALISLMVCLLALASLSFGPDWTVFSAGHSRSIDLIKFSASAF